MPSAAEIAGISIKLDIGGKPSLFVLLHEDGSINRMGTGVVDDPERTLHIGVTREPLFQSLREVFSDELLDHCGRYDLTVKEGQPCLLVVVLQFHDGTANGFEFTYGSESQGPPPGIRRAVL